VVDALESIKRKYAILFLARERNFALQHARFSLFLFHTSVSFVHANRNLIFSHLSIFLQISLSPSPFLLVSTYPSFTPPIYIPSRIFIFPRVCSIRAVIISTTPISNDHSRTNENICSGDLQVWLLNFLAVFLLLVSNGNVTFAIYFWRTILRGFEKDEVDG